MDNIKTGVIYIMVGVHAVRIIFDALVLLTLFLSSARSLLLVIFAPLSFRWLTINACHQIIHTHLYHTNRYIYIYFCFLAYLILFMHASISSSINIDCYALNRFLLCRLTFSENKYFGKINNKNVFQTFFNLSRKRYREKNPP